MKKTFESTQTAVRTPLKLAAAAAAALLILSGCAVGPNYVRREPDARAVQRGSCRLEIGHAE